MNTPTVSVVIPTYNRQQFIGTAVQSIVRQTFADWELIVVDDGSTDRTAEVVASMRDRRIRIVRLETNRRIATARNRGLQEASGRYVAWLDSDDLARPDRLAVQTAYLEANPDIAVVGGCAHKISAGGSRLRGTRVPPFRHDDIRCRQLLTSAFQQSTVMGRADILKAHPYDASFEVCEDIDVFVRIAALHRLANLPKVLVDRRMHATQISRQQRHKVLAAQVRISRPQFDQMRLELGDAEIIRLCALARTPTSRPSNDDLHWAETALTQLLSANARSGVFPDAALRMYAGLLLFKRYKHRSFGRAVRALATSQFAGDLVQLRSATWFASALQSVMTAH